jgi:hypothetical protein
MRARALATVIGTAMVIASCSSEPRDPTAAIVERSWNVIGEVTAVSFGQGYTHEPSDFVTSSGGPGWDFDFRVGPMELTMGDGTALNVGAHTPGGNYCRVLLTPQDRIDLTGMPEPTDSMVDAQVGGPNCWIVGETNDDGRTVRWFETRTGYPSGDVAVGHAVAVDGTGILTDQGWRFPYADGERSRPCGGDTTLAELIADGVYPGVLFNAATKSVSRLDCPARM